MIVAKLEAIGDVAVSPDGETVAYVRQRPAAAARVAGKVLAQITR